MFWFGSPPPFAVLASSVLSLPAKVSTRVLNAKPTRVTGVVGVFGGRKSIHLMYCGALIRRKRVWKRPRVDNRENGKVDLPPFEILLFFAFV